MKSLKIISFALGAFLIFPATGNACQMLGSHASARQHNMAHDGTPTCRKCSCAHYKNDTRDPKEISKVTPHPHVHTDGDHQHKHHVDKSKNDKSG